MLGSLSVLFIYGFLTFLRIIWSNRSIDIHQKLMNCSAIMLEKSDPSQSIYRILNKKMDTHVNPVFKKLKGTLRAIHLFC